MQSRRNPINFPMRSNNPQPVMVDLDGLGWAALRGN